VAAARPDTLFLDHLVGDFSSSRSLAKHRLNMIGICCCTDYISAPPRLCVSICRPGSISRSGRASGRAGEDQALAERLARIRGWTRGR
jgi:hypothetical protein